MGELRDKIVDTTDKGIQKKDRVITQALSRFRLVVNSEKENRVEALDDLNMLAGINHWPAKVVAARELEGRPVLTVNKLPGFADRVVNESRINEVGIKVIPYGGGSSVEIAELYNGLIKSIENNSDAEVAYQTALEGAVYCGFGYFRVITTYANETSWEQEIEIRRIKNNMSVYLDPAATKHNCSDGRFAFITEMISRKEYEIRYPKLAPPEPLQTEDDSEVNFWIEEERVRVGEYWVKVPKKKTICLLSDGRTVDGEEWEEALPGLEAEEKIIHLAPGPDGQPVVTPGPAPEGSGLPEDVVNPVPKVLKTRQVESHVVHQYLIDGSKIIEGPTEWPGTYIPIIPVWGKEIVINDKTLRRGVIRFAKDSQKMYNYFRTAATETVAMTPKAPYVIAAEQIEGYEDEWAESNTANKPYLTYNHVAGLNPPIRQVVTQTAIGEITESNISSDEIKDTTSIHDASLGIAGNEVSGRAIARRQSQSDVTNFTYPDNLKRAIKYAGKIIVDIIPRIYDTERQVMIIRPNEDQELVTINQTVITPASGKKTIINDLTQGQYAVTVITGPNFNTQREEAAASMLDFIRVAPDAATMVIDLIAENQNWPGATKIAERFRKTMLPAGIDDKEPPPPPPPTLEDTTKELKIQGIRIDNVKKGLEVVEKRKELTDETGELVRLVEQLKKLGLLAGEGGNSGT